MQVPYVTHCFKAVVRHEELPPAEPIQLAHGGEDEQTEDTGPVVPQEHARPGKPEDPGMQLIDFR